MIDGLVKSALNGDRKDYCHGVLGFVIGIFRALANSVIVRDSDQLLDKINSLLTAVKCKNISKDLASAQSSPLSIQHKAGLLLDTAAFLAIVGKTLDFSSR